MTTLRFASTVKNIKVKAVPVAGADKMDAVAKMKSEIEQLKAQLAAAKEGGPMPTNLLKGASASDLVISAPTLNLETATLRS